jgi:hypothetical protein
MNQDWDFYMLRVDDQLASTYVDLALAQVAPITSQPVMAYLSLTMRAPRPDGLSSNEEYDALIALEDALEARIRADAAATYAGRCTTAGHRDFYFYVADPATFTHASESAMAAFPEYLYATGHRDDPDWTAYRDFLYPGARDLQRIRNRRVVDVLQANDDNISLPRLIDHRAYLPTRSAVAALQAQLLAQGFGLVGEPGDEKDEDLALDFARIDRPDDIDAVVLPLFDAVVALGGNYDGWGCEVESAAR